MSYGKGQSFDTGLMQAIFTAVFSNATVTSLFQNAGSPLTSLYVALHSTDPTATGSQTSNEISYTSYARVAVARTTGGWTVGTATVSPAATISFPACTGGTATATYWSVGTAFSGAGNLLYAGSLSPSISISNGVTPQLTSSSAITES